MRTKRLIWTVLALSPAMLSVPVGAADTGNAEVKAQAPQAVFGSQLMTRQERIEYRNKMRNLKTPEERDAFRLEHHKLMQQRAKERGLTLPDEPPAGGARMGRGGMGPGSGMGPGMGQGMGGQGMGPGGAMRQSGGAGNATGQGAGAGAAPDNPAK
jgi:hypothetical protein